MIELKSKILGWQCIVALGFVSDLSNIQIERSLTKPIYLSIAEMTLKMGLPRVGLKK